jgi:hypothetical protein
MIVSVVGRMCQILGHCRACRSDSGRQETASRRIHEASQREPNAMFAAKTVHRFSAPTKKGMRRRLPANAHAASAVPPSANPSKLAWGGRPARQ